MMIIKRIFSYMCVDGLGKGSVPVVDDAVDLRLDQQLRPLSSLQLRWDNAGPPGYKSTPARESTSGCERSVCTSMTCFLLDFSLEAHSTEPPRSSTVNSGLDWLPPNFWRRQAGIHSTKVAVALRSVNEGLMGYVPSWRCPPGPSQRAGRNPAAPSRRRSSSSCVPQ